MSEGVGIEPRVVATKTLAVRRSVTPRPDLVLRIEVQYKCQIALILGMSGIADKEVPGKSNPEMADNPCSHL